MSDVCVAHRQPPGEAFSVDRKSQGPGGLGEQGVAEGRRAFDGFLPAAGGQGARGVVEALGLHRVDFGAGGKLGEGQGAAGNQSAAAAGRQQRIQLGPGGFRLAGYFQADGALAGDDQGVVIGRHQGGAAPLGDVACDHVTVFAVAIIEHHFGAPGAGVVDLDRRRVGRHDDGGGGAHGVGRGGDALGVIARREGDHAALDFAGVEAADAVVGAAELERPGALQGLGLDQQAAADAFVQQGRFEQRRDHGHAFEAARGGDDVGEDRRIKGQRGSHRWRSRIRVRREAVHDRRRPG